MKFLIFLPNGVQSRCSFKKRFFLIALLGLIVQAGCKNESGITEISNGPEIQSTDPAGDAVDIDVTASVSATFSDEMDPSTITDSTFLLRLDTVAVSGTITYTDSTATFIPSNNLDFESTYTATVTADVQNMDGDAMDGDYEWEFTTADKPEETDDTPPQVVSTTPDNEEEDVSINTAVIATFDEPMNESTINTTTFSLQQGSTPISGNVTYSESRATFSPSSPLDYDKTYTGTLTTNVKDTAGNALAESYRWSFTTGDQPDNTPPQINATDPTDNEQDVSVSSNVTVDFNEAISASSINNSTFIVEREGNQIPGAYNVSGNTATFNPSNDLSFESSYTVTVTTGVEDLEGNNLENEFSWNFTTADEPDNTPPQVTDTDPDDGAEDVSIDTEIRATFNEPIDALNPDNAFDLEQNGSSVSGSVDISGNTIIFTPSSDLSYENSYKATVTTSIRDLAGNNLENEFSWDFTTSDEPDNTPPRVTSTDPADNAEDVSVDTEISATFSESIHASNPDDAFVLEQNGSSVSGSVAISDSTITFTPSSDLDNESTYTATITTVIEDSEGNNLENEFSWNFTTADEPDDTPPRVTDTDPADGAGGVRIDTEITATFSEPLNPSTVTNGNFFLEQGNSRISGSLSSSGNTVVLTPSRDLDYESTYSVTATTGIEDAAGNSLENDVEWSFTTEEEPDNTAPEINSTNPTNGETDVSVNIDEITVTFSEFMNSDTFDEDSFTLTQSGDEVDGNIPDFEGATARFFPDDGLKYNAIYTVSISSEVEDLEGNKLEDDFEWSFTTEDEPNDDGGGDDDDGGDDGDGDDDNDNGDNDDD